MDNSETVRIAIVAPPNTRRNARESRKRHEEESLNVTVECAAVARATCRQLSRPAAGIPQFTMMRCSLLENSKARQPAWPSALTSSGGGLPVSINNVLGPASRRWYPE